MADETRRLLWRAVPSRSDAYAARARRYCERFVREICGLAGDWTMPDYIEEAVAGSVAGGHDEVVLGLSGGVDSAVAAALIHRAIGEQLTCIFVDTGLLRLNEAER